MNENGEQDEQEMSSHVMRHYFKVNGRAMEDHVGTEGANKHSYFLRAKPKAHRYEVMNKERPSSSPARSKSEHFDEYSASSEDEDLANCLVMLSNKSHPHHNDENKGKHLVEKGMFQCKACKKIFNSHQALGGHRASHKKVKGCFAAKLDGDEEQDSVQEEHDPVILTGSQPARSAPTGKRPKMHECSVCRRVFSSGQALGGHKRCHWLTTSTDNAFIPSFQDFQYGHQNQQQQQQLCKEPMLITNPPNHHHDQQQDHHDQQLDLNLNLLPVVPHRYAEDNTSRFEASTRFYLQQQKIPNTGKNDNDDNNDQTGGDQVNKIRKLSDLRDVNYDGGWLQMGIASTADIMY